MFVCNYNGITLSSRSLISQSIQSEHGQQFLKFNETSTQLNPQWAFAYNVCINNETSSLYIRDSVFFFIVFWMDMDSEAYWHNEILVSFTILIPKQKFFHLKLLKKFLTKKTWQNIWNWKIFFSVSICDQKILICNCKKY